LPAEKPVHWQAVIVRQFMRSLMDAY